jgi:PAS domain-containing protein
VTADSSDELLSARADTFLQQTLLGDAAEHAAIGVVVWNEELRYVAVNQWVAELFGVSREQLLGSRVGDQNTRPEARQAIEAVLDELPARGRLPVAPGMDADWIVVETQLAGLPHFFGLFWPVT